jgi:hypothetical protein
LGLLWTYVGAEAPTLYPALAFARRCTLIEHPAIQILSNLHHNNKSATEHHTPQSKHFNHSKKKEIQLTPTQQQQPP